MPDLTTMLLILTFLCVMTGLVSPGVIIKQTIPNVTHRKLILLGLGGITLTGSILCATTFEDSAPKETQTVLKDLSSSPSQDMNTNHMVIDGVIVEVVEVELNHEDGLIQIQLMMDNQSTEVISYNPYQFLIETEAGKKFVPSLHASPSENLLGAGDLNPLEKIEGTLTYSLSSDERPVALQYIPIATEPGRKLTFDLNQTELQTIEQVDSNQLTVTKTVAIGEIIEQRGISYQVLEVNRLSKIGSTSPKGGHEFLKVNLSLKNTASDNLLLFPYHFELQTGKQVTLKPLTSLIEQEGLLSLSELVSGGVITSSIIFEIPKSATDLTLSYVNPLHSYSPSLAIDLQSDYHQGDLLTPSIELISDWITGNHLVPSVLEGMELTTYSSELKEKTHYSQSKKEHQFLLVDVSLKNRSEQKRKYTAFDFKVLTPEGQIIMPSLTLIDNQSEFKSGELAFEEEITGTLLFEVETVSTTFSLIYSPSNWVNHEKLIIPLN